jgi:hypothetical protein
VLCGDTKTDGLLHSKRKLTTEKTPCKYIETKRHRNRTHDKKKKKIKSGVSSPFQAEGRRRRWERAVLLVGSASQPALSSPGWLLSCPSQQPAAICLQT